MPDLHVHFLPELIEPRDLAGSAVVVIDVLRATTTIVHALAAGACEVIPCLEVDEAKSIAAGLPAGMAVLGGERGGLRIPGFDLGNSPREYLRETVGGKTVILTTTNGTKALRHCRHARRVVIGALVNSAAVAQAVAAEPVLHVVCAGTRGQSSLDDVLAAGRICEQLLSRRSESRSVDSSALVALELWTSQVGANPDALDKPAGEGVPLQARIVNALRDTQGGRDLIELGFDLDIEVASRVDSQLLVPELDPVSWRIRVL